MAVQFRCVNAAIIRAPANDGKLRLPPWPDLSGDGATDAQVRAWQTWLREIWEHEVVAEAIETASPVLADRVERLLGGGVQQPRRVRRVVESVMRYLLRLTTRATPFGLFAGVAPVVIGSGARVRWGDCHRAVARPDARWLAELIRHLEGRPEVLRRLPVVATDLGVVRGERLVVASQPGSHASGEVLASEVSIRCTRAVRTVLQAARSPITVDALIGELTTEFPGRPPAALEALLTELVSLRVLISSLHAPMDVTDPLGHVIDELAHLGTSTEGEQPEVAADLRTVSEQLTRHTYASSPEERRAIRASVTRRMKAVCPGAAPSLTVDLRLDCSVVLPPAVAREAEAGASALVRLTPYPYGDRVWRDWHARFLERYGLGAVVPLSQIVDEDAGLGYPTGYHGSLRRPPSPPLSDRDRRLLHLAQRATLDGVREVELDEQTVSELAAALAHRGEDPPLPVETPPHTEMYCSLHARTTDALDRGDFTLVVANASRRAGITTGRFLPLFDPADRERMAREYKGLPTVIAGSRLAQVSCPPLSALVGNFARTPALFSPISLGEHRPADKASISLDDLAVSGDAHRLFLVSLSRGQIVEPVMVNAVDPRRGTRALVRFLCEISTAHVAACVSFTWGAARYLPFLPRLRYGRTVLRPARWKVSAAELPGRGTDRPQWERAWARHRSRFRIPDEVLLGENDVRIRLDLTEPAHRVLLRSHLDRYDDAILTEAPARDDYGWIDGSAHEIVFPLATTEPAATPPPRSASPSRPIPTTHHPGHAPGSSAWLSGRLHAGLERQTDILTVHLSELLTIWDEGPSNGWWFLRYREPEPHVRLRIPLRDARDYGAAAQRLGRCAERLRRLGLLRDLVLDTYYPETGQYGTGAAMGAAEAVFAADSAAAVLQLKLTAEKNPHPYAITAASFTDLVSAFTGGPDHGLRWLIHHVPHVPAPALARGIHAQAMLLADPTGDRAALHALPRAAGLGQAWTQRRSALENYRAHLTDARSPGPDALLTSLLRLHHVRMFGRDPDSERACLQLARAVALRWTARHADSP